MKIISSKSIYWLFALRIINRNDVSCWADNLVNLGCGNSNVFDLSTCSQLDDNDIMGMIKSIKDEYENINVDVELLTALRDYYLKIDNGKTVNLSMILDFSQIDDLKQEIRHELDWLADDISLSRDGIKIFQGNESSTIVIEIDKIISAQQGDAPVPASPAR